MNPLILHTDEKFRTGTDTLTQFNHQLIKMENGVLLFCHSGEANLTVNMERIDVTANTTVILLPGSILAVNSATPDFLVHYFAYSEEMFHSVSFRLPPAFFHFLKNNPCYIHTEPADLDAVIGLVKASNSIYLEKEHHFRNAIASNLLQIFFLDTYGKSQYRFTHSQTESSSRRDELFKRFIQLVQTHCVTQRDVTFYARQLCISTRYLSAITQQMGKESAKEIIDNNLILELKMTLQSTDLSLKEIADRFHFPDQSFFGRYFKKHTGMSPKAFRLSFTSSRFSHK